MMGASTAAFTSVSLLCPRGPRSTKRGAWVCSAAEAHSSASGPERRNAPASSGASASPTLTSFERRAGGPLLRRAVNTLQVNIGLTCNQACSHCHVASSPSRKETMSQQVAEQLVKLVANTPSIQTVDITGGAPEMHEQFTYLVESMRALDKVVIDRCNLTVLSLAGMQNLASYLAHHKVKVVASLPCYSKENVDKQRGDAVFEASIAGLQQLNALGYGEQLELDLVYNPSGAFLPGPQAPLEDDYKRILDEMFGIRFNRLITITNMPIKRFRVDLQRSGKLEEYQNLLEASFNPETLGRLMCEGQVHVDYAGRLSDCDFNYALGMAMGVDERACTTVFDLERLDETRGCRIATGSHCFGCTAGAGSSCGGALL
ncbi:hypothetical protein FVE85_7977 [Porphyridium purpureum]|uniref:Radical SAM/Cys-rich domain protein n=1 Tax=Porphyridium purpureum TaxID=35688 RepID=A0A5J4YNF7_PORPP|nr:hypothetical protein FVE85_7977 [Porphyridium purpureum]|eukprot:POR3871..scf295_9